MFFRKIKVLAGIFIALFMINLSAYSSEKYEFCEALGNRETRGHSHPYSVVNEYGFIGRYQFGEGILHDLKYYNDRSYYPDRKYENTWEGKWTGRKGVWDIRDILGHKHIQEIIIREEIKLNQYYIKKALIKNISRLYDRLEISGEIDLYDDRELRDSLEVYIENNRYARKYRYTKSGILAGAHLCGANAAIDFLKDGKMSQDENGTKMTEYMRIFSGYRF